MSILSLFEGFGIDLAAEAAKAGIELEQLAEHEGAEVVADFESLFKAGVPFALEAIKEQATKTISGDEKFSTAVTVVWEKLQAQFGPVVKQDVTTIVQNTYNGLLKIAQGG